MVNEQTDVKAVFQDLLCCHRVQAQSPGRIPSQVQDHQHRSNLLFLRFQDRRIGQEAKEYSYR